VKILVLAPSYPYPDHPFAGVFNEKCVCVLRELCNCVEVLVPRPYAPSVLASLVPRWKAYSRIVEFEVRNGVPVYRPAYLQIPRLGGAFWTDPGTFLWCRRTARNMHRRVQFDAIVSFDLVGSGGMAWRIGRDLRIPASGWATGDDVRFPASSSHGRVLLRAIEHLDVVFYQSHELLGEAANLLGISPAQMSHDRHVVLSRGIPAPPFLPRAEVRHRMREMWGVTNEQVAVLYVGRVVREKGMFELLDAISLAAAQDPRITCIIVGSKPAFDETTAVQKKLDQTPALRERVRLLPACSPDKVWEYLCAADIFAFPSYKDGMPNSLLEAMAMGVPTVAFAIPPVLEIEAGTGGVVVVPPFDSALFSQAMLRLATSSADRVRVGEKGKAEVMDRFMVRKNMAKALLRLTQVIQRRDSSQRVRYRHC
jgi:teichuronic acid biosynthesis glycosyltransferase TuaC